MALTKAEQDQLKALQEKEKRTDDDDEVVIWVRTGDHETRLTGARAEAWCRRNGYDIEDAEDSTKADPLEGGDAASSTKPATGAASKKTKAAATGAKDDDKGGELEELPEDPPAGGARRARQFF